VGGTYSTNSENEKCVQNLVGNPLGNRSLGVPRRGWEDYIATEIWCRIMN